MKSPEANPAAADWVASVHDFELTALNGQPLRLADYHGSVLLIVNTASRCGFTPQYAGLEALYQTYRDRGFVVIGTPCNQFGAQEPGSADEIAEFCTSRFSVSFPMSDKLEVKGEGAHPLYRFLCAQAPGLLGTTQVKWNFTKFLCNRQGQVVDRFAPTTSPESIKQAIEALL